MKEYKKWQLIIKIVFFVVIVGVLILVNSAGDTQEERYDTIQEKIFKISAFFMVILALIMFWVLPNTKLAKHLKMNESLFTWSHILGAICGATGLIATLFWGNMVVETHFFEFIVILFGLIFMYWHIVLKAKKTTEVSRILDEKQIDNIMRAAGGTLFIVTCIMVLMYFISYHHAFTLEGKIWFLFYFFLTLLIYSGSTLYYFKKA